MSKLSKCDCYHTQKKRRYTFHPITGNPIGHDVDVSVCYGTKEIDECHCGGDRTKCDFYADVRKAARKEQNTRKWISTSDRLPEHSNDVLLFTTFNTFDVGYYDGVVWYAADVLLEREDVTHWMPLPAPPKF